MFGLSRVATCISRQSSSIRFSLAQLNIPNIYHGGPLLRAISMRPSARSFWTGRKVDPGFTYCFVDEIVNHWDVDWILPTLRSTLKQYCIDLGLWDEGNNCVNYKWHVETTSPDALRSLPKRRPHAGDYEWIGKPSQEPPKWLWDSKTGKTVPATKERLREGYMAVSYTWGRWCNKNEWRNIDGVPWKVPTIKPGGCDITELLPVLETFPNTRYFWIDVLCINQQDHVERHQEISKQGSIFAKAKGVLIYLWTIPKGHNLALGLCHLGDSVLLPSRLNPRGIPNMFKNNATYRGRLYTKGPKEERSVTPFAWAIQADPWFTSLWTMQEMILCPSGILMAKNGEVCTVNGQAVTVAFVATAIELAKRMIEIRLMLTEMENLIDTFIPSKRKKFVLSMMQEVLQDLEKSGQLSPAIARFLDVTTELRDRRMENFIIDSRYQIWGRWKDKASLDSCLTADRCDILNAVTKRQASGRRGEAVLAALKVAPFEGAFDANGVTASGLPAPLLDKILKAEGRTLFLNENDGNGAKADAFFSNVSPQSTDTRHHDTTIIGRASGAYVPVPEKDWSINSDETLHIPFCSKLQAPNCRKVSISLNGNANIGVELIWDMSKSPKIINNVFRKWRKRQLMKNSIWRGLDLDMFHDENMPQDPHDENDMPRGDIDVRFVPLAYMKEPEDTKKISAEARKDPLQKGVFDFLNLNTGVDDRVIGIILASDAADAATGNNDASHAIKSKKWYKCGSYTAFGEYKPFLVPEREGMTVGRL